jgi:hypothetical protein
LNICVCIHESIKDVTRKTCTTVSSDRRTRATEKEEEKTGNKGNRREDREGERKDKTLKERRTYKRRT